MQQQQVPLPLVVIGNVNSGKSTTIGHLIYHCGEISQEIILENENEARILGKVSYKYCWILDQLKVERERNNTTIFPFCNIFTPQNSLINVIEASGHRNFLKNLITGTSQANAALLMIDCTPEAYTIGITPSGLIREQTTLISSFGIKQMIIGINKMDCVDYSECRYHDIKEEITAMLQEIGYLCHDLIFVPLSGWNGDNIFEPSAHMAWYHGPTLIQALGRLSHPSDRSEMPLRLPLQDVYKLGGVGTVPAGRVESGTLQEGMQIVFAPSGILSEVRSIETRRAGLTEARPGYSIGFHCPGIAVGDIRRGEVVSDPTRNPARGCDTFQAVVIIRQHADQILPGFSAQVFIHTAQATCVFKSLDAKLERRTGGVVQNCPPFLRSGDLDVCCLVTLEPLAPLVVEPFFRYPSLGRFIVKHMRQTVAIGVVTRVTTKEMLGKGARRSHGHKSTPSK